MNDISKLKWKDIVSPTMTSDDYLKEFKDKIDHNYKTYEPKEEILGKIKKLLMDKNEKLKIVALGADWCPDCNNNIPRMIKIKKLMNSDNMDFKILYGIMVNAHHKDRPNEPIWHKKRSPPEANDPKFDLKKIPTFYLFKSNDNLIGTIVENPKATLEEDVLEILERSLK
ncbi:MAG: thioredoxin family protein [Promethearchaeota archaeon]